MFGFGGFLDGERERGIQIERNRAVRLGKAGEIFINLFYHHYVSSQTDDHGSDSEPPTALNFNLLPIFNVIIYH